MAITNNGVKVLLPAGQIPAGFSLPVVTTFTDFEYKRSLTLAVLKSTVENATKTTTLQNILDNVAIGLKKQLDDIIAADYLATATVTHFTELTAISHNIDPNNASDFYNNVAVSYSCKLTLFVKAA